MEYQFKTNINCGSCVNAVKGFLNDETAIQSWEVDTNNPNKILRVTSNQLSAEEIKKVVEEAGFDIEVMA